MLSSDVIAYLEKQLLEKICKVTPLAGGDINEVYALETSTQKFVVKTNSASRFPAMFEAETKGLTFLRDSNTFTVPKVIFVGEYNDTAVLILSYMHQNVACKDFWQIFGRSLARLHQYTDPQFGFENDNYIGSLPQYNARCGTSLLFYRTQRLQPQFDLALQHGFIFKHLDPFYKTLEDIIPEESSSLIHGDLWNGNYIIDTTGNPCLIDPAIAFASREMDIAMMHLFGGFKNEVFDAYQEAFPLVEGWKTRLPLWQLYYILVHLNLFGSSYYNRAQKIIEMYL